ncbi:uncharacterized protein LOC128958695 [Oppia nitens]|uniref:uncharacterized protein LOC128958695 n=1 Tax=Oppia nitens TaxID=1686743 RepID=UPI0023DBA6AF|nr:uncharacterized protein LOC128958695 [Oppia nitens]
MSNNNNNSNTSSHSSTSSSKTNSSRRGITSQTIIPDEVGSPDCPVCLNRVQNRAYTNRCLHEFCYSCIKEWSQQHNRCPVCRGVYSNILHNIRSKEDYDIEVVEEPIEDGVGALVTLGNSGIAMLVTPPENGVYLIEPRETPYGIRHNIMFYGPNQVFLLHNVNQNMVLTTAERLEPILRELGATPYRPHNGRHSPFLRRHRHQQ